MILYFSERVKVSTLECYYGTSSLWTTLWFNLCNLRPVVIVVIKSRWRILCTILGYRNWNWLRNNIGLRTLARKESRIDYGCNNGMCTERNKCFAFDLLEVLTPNLDVIFAPSFVPAVFRTIFREYSFKNDLCEVFKVNRID